MLIGIGHSYQLLEFEGIQFAVHIESRTQNEHSEYYPFNILYYVAQGQLNIKYKHQLYTISKGDFCIVRKFTGLSYFKTWDEDEDCAKINALALRDEFIQDAIKELEYKIPAQSISGPVVNLKKNPILMGLKDSLSLYFAENQVPDKKLMYLKTKEAILGIFESNPDHLAIFDEFSKPVKANLHEFMVHNKLHNVSLSELAKLSGRSLSTFNRDFKKIFNTSPHKWLLKNRLEKAKELLISTQNTASDIYLDLGFKDLAHFSRVFKKEFGVPPSEIRTK